MISLPYIVSRIIEFYGLLLFVYVLLSWFPAKSGIIADIDRVLASICEPYIGIFRRILPVAAVGGAGLDFSPLVALLVLQYLLRPLFVALAAAIA